MAVNCSQCGEELLGSVNRCWRCGREYVSLPGPANLPPVRRAPLDPVAVSIAAIPQDPATADSDAASENLAPSDAGGPSAALQDEVVSPDGMTEATAASGAQPASTSSQDSSFDSELTPLAAEWPLPEEAVPPPAADPPQPAPAASGQGGSPFAAGAQLTTSPLPSRTIIRTDSRIFSAPARPPNYPRHAAAVGGAVASFALGVMSLIAAMFTVGALFTALLGLAMGIWGAYSDRRVLAMIGMLLCCLALAIAGVYGVIDLYHLINDGNILFEAAEPLGEPEY